MTLTSSSYRYGTIAFRRGSSTVLTSVPVRRRRRRLGDLASSRCLFQPRLRLRRPVAVLRNRLAAALFVFIFGILFSMGAPIWPPNPHDASELPGEAVALLDPLVGPLFESAASIPISGAATRQSTVGPIAPQ